MTKKLAPLLLMLLLAALAWAGMNSLPSGAKPQDVSSVRRPIALALVDNGKTLLIAQRGNGALAFFDTTSLKVISETRVSGTLSDLAATPEGDRLVLVDEAAGELVVLDYAKRAITEKRRVKVGLSPVSVRVFGDGRLATVALLWPRQLAILDLDAATAPTLLDLPFAPRKQLLLPGTYKLIVADSFGANLAVVDVRQRRVDRVCALTTIHNIRGLALDRSGKHLLLTHQRLHASGHPSRGDIQSGNLVDNELRRVPLADILNPLVDPLRYDRVHPLGDIDRGAGDPADIRETAAGKTVVAFAGVNEVAVGYPEKATWTRLAVGKRPTVFALDAAGKRAFVANTFGDSISVVDLEALKVVAEVSLGEGPSELQARQRGEMLFFDAGLSMDGWFSCHSCHTDGHTNGRLNDNLTDGSFGTPKRVLSLLGVKDTGPWAWNGKMPDLKAQIRHSLSSTMQGGKPSEEKIRDLETYLETLTPPPSVSQARGKLDPTLLQRGREVFAEQKCGNCHTEPTYTSPRTYDVGLSDEAGHAQFNPPSLRGISQAGPFFHDNRARSLSDIFTRHRHRVPVDLPQGDLEALMRFLESL